MVMLSHAVWTLATNTTTIETWEIERHERLVRRAKSRGGYLDGPDGIKIKIQKQEFPFDIGICANIKQGMGTGNIFAWFWPLSASPTSSGLVFETNGFEEPSCLWPPPDPDRIPRLRRAPASTSSSPKHYRDQWGHPQQEDDVFSEVNDIQAFKMRQQADRQRQRAASFAIWSPPKSESHLSMNRVPTYHSQQQQRYLRDDDDHLQTPSYSPISPSDFNNMEHLSDYGVDEFVELNDQQHGRLGNGVVDLDEVVLSELVRRRCKPKV